MEVDPKKLKFGVLHEFFAHGEEYMGKLETERQAAKKWIERAKGRPDRKLRPGLDVGWSSLRVRFLLPLFGTGDIISCRQRA